jgi:tRNA U34 5-carboxymethylaminomethyl modifying enzyme MnmG/GidA
VKEMDDEEQSYSSIQEPLYRVETGNYEYRLVLRCRQDARAKFAKLRNDVLEKIELLEAKHAQSLADNLKKLLEGLYKFTQDAVVRFESTKGLFPIEVSLKSNAFEYESTKTFSADGQDEEEVAQAEEAKEVKEEKKVATNGNQDFFDLMMATTSTETSSEPEPKIQSNVDLLTAEPSTVTDSLLPDLQSLNFNQPSTITTTTTQDLLADLGLDEVDLTITKICNTASHSIDDLLN